MTVDYRKGTHFKQVRACSNQQRKALKGYVGLNSRLQLVVSLDYFVHKAIFIIVIEKLGLCLKSGKISSFQGFHKVKVPFYAFTSALIKCQVSSLNSEN